MPAAPKSHKPDMRYKFSNINVMLVDSDPRSASLVNQLLTSFGFRKIKIVHSGAEAMKHLRTGRTDLIITEWSTGPVGGIALVKAIRTAKNDKLISHITPVIMLTARSETECVKQARDVGITEFLAKPFSAKTLSNRLIEVMNAPREFIETPTFSGPSRRRREGPPPGTEDRRLPRDERQRRDGPNKVIVTRPDTSLRDLIDGVNAMDILTDELIAEAQADLMKSENEFVNWVKEDIAQLEIAYARLAQSDEPEARAQLTRAAYTIKSQSGTFGYDMGTLVADMLIRYVQEHVTTTENTLLVIRKHIDTLGVIISHQVKDASSHVGLALIDSLNKLVEKFR